jgi:hypothetical protein
MNTVLKNKMKQTAKKMAFMPIFILGAVAGVAAYIELSRPLTAQVVGTPYIVPSVAGKCDAFPFTNTDFLIPTTRAGFNLGSDPSTGGIQPVNLPELKKGTWILIVVFSALDASTISGNYGSVSTGVTLNSPATVTYGVSKLIQNSGGNLNTSVNYRSIALFKQWAVASIMRQANSTGLSATAAAVAVHLNQPVPVSTYVTNPGTFYVQGIQGSFGNTTTGYGHMLWVFLGDDASSTLYNSL